MSLEANCSSSASLIAPNERVSVDLLESSGTMILELNSSADVKRYKSLSGALYMTSKSRYVLQTVRGRMVNTAVSLLINAGFSE